MILHIAVAVSQSNAQGATGPVNPACYSPVPDPARAFEYLFTQVGTNGGRGSFVSLADPMSRDKQVGSTLPTRRSNTGSPWPALCCRLLELRPDITRLNVAHYAVSGSTVAQQPRSTSNANWSLNGVNGVGTLRAAARLHIAKMLEAAGNAPLDWLISMIGENEFYSWLNKYPNDFAALPNGYVCAEYPNGFPNPNNLPSLFDLYAEVYTWFQGQFPGVKILLIGTGPWGSRPANEQLTGPLANVVKRELATTLPDVYFLDTPMGFTVGNGKVRADDTVHYTQLGANEVGNDAADLIASTLPPLA